MSARAARDTWSARSASATETLQALSDPPSPEIVRRALVRLYDDRGISLPSIVFSPSPKATARIMGLATAAGALARVGRDDATGPEPSWMHRRRDAMLVRQLQTSWSQRGTLGAIIANGLTEGLKAAHRNPEFLQIVRPALAFTPDIARIAVEAEQKARVGGFPQRYLSPGAGVRAALEAILSGGDPRIALDPIAMEKAFHRFMRRGARVDMRTGWSARWSWALLDQLMPLDAAIRLRMLPDQNVKTICDIRTVLCGTFMLHENPHFLLVTLAPARASFDAGGRLHGENGPALRFADRSQHWALEGLVVPRSLVLGAKLHDTAATGVEANALVPETVRGMNGHMRSAEARRVLAEADDRLRRLMIERYRGRRGPAGWETWLEDLGARVIDQDERHGRLYQVAGRSPFTVLRVRCPSSGQIHHLQTPPAMQTARSARAWTFGVDLAALDNAVET